MNLILYDLSKSTAGDAANELRAAGKRKIATANSSSYPGGFEDKRQLAEDGQLLIFLSERFETLYKKLDKAESWQELSK